MHLLILVFVFVYPTWALEKPRAPIAAEKLHKLEAHGDVRIDPYYWLRDKTNPEVIRYLESENAYTQSVLKPQEKLQKQLVKEMRDRIQEDDVTFPEKDGDYEYYTRTKKGLEYDIFCRKKVGKPKAKEEVILDLNDLAKGHTSISVPNFVLTDDGRLMAYALDTKGDRVSTIFFKNLETGQLLKHQIADASNQLAWAADGKTLFYVKYKKPNLQERWVRRFNIDTGSDELVYEEPNEQFTVEVYRSISHQFIFIPSYSKDSSEVRYLRADSPTASPKVFAPRQDKMKYQVADAGDRFFVRTNYQAENFKLVETPLDDTKVESWKDVIPARPETFLDSFRVFASHVAVVERKDGLPIIRVLDRKTSESATVPIKESVYKAWLEGNHEYNTQWLRFGYNSMTTPASTVEYHFQSRKVVVRKLDPVRGKFNSKNYVTKRLWADANGVKIPISIVYRKTTRLTPQTPLLLYGYGAYGKKIDPYFSSNRLSLLDRGFVYAIAHIRGGGELGQPWYLQGKLLNKKNSFTDFIASAEELFRNKISSPRHAYIMGESAGGLLMGAVVNMRGDLFHGAILGVPFLDVLTDMLDTSLPLTTIEFPEWGNPQDKIYYDYIKTYSPYDGIRKGKYPNMLVTAGLNDSQVFYWEPAKWVAKLRKTKTDDNLLLLQTEMETGHGGKNGRFDYLKEIALKYAFLLRLENAQP